MNANHQEVRGGVSYAMEDPATEDVMVCIRKFFSDISHRIEGFDPQLSISANSEEMQPPAGAFFVARRGGEVVGCMGVKLHPGAYAELKRMWVSPEARGAGIARKLIELAENHVRNAQIYIVRLETNNGCPEAIGLYRSSGYVNVPAFSDEFYAHHWFEKRLTP